MEHRAWSMETTTQRMVKIIPSDLNLLNDLKVLNRAGTRELETWNFELETLTYDRINCMEKHMA